MNEPIRINLVRGLMGICERFASKIPHGQTVMNAGLREVLHEGLKQNPAIPQEDLSLMDLARKVGFLNPLKDEPPQLQNEVLPRRSRR